MSAPGRFLIFWISIVGFNCELAYGEVVIGSKKFTESVILGEIARISLNEKDLKVKHISELGGTRILWNALRQGDIDVYPDYTSTLTEEILRRKFRDFQELRFALAEHGIGITQPLGFNNSYAIGMMKERARSLGIKKISDLARHPGLRFGWGDEFRRREDGWPGLRERYRLSQRFVRGLDHDIAYRALRAGDIDVTDLYSTDAEIQYYDLEVLEDDQSYFPNYDAVFLYRLEAVEKFPEIREALRVLEGRIPQDQMIAMNREAKIEKKTSAQVAEEYWFRQFGRPSPSLATHQGERIWVRTREHLFLVFFSLVSAISFAVPLGILAEKRKLIGKLILGFVGAIQTIPSLALLVILIKPLNLIGLRGIGDTPALIALFLYSLLPIVRATHSGFEQIPSTLREASAVLNFSLATRLMHIELPLALPAILSGIKTAAVMNVGFATLGALIGAGGYGQPILTGIRLDDYGLILEGALPSAALALLVQHFFELGDRLLVSRGLRK